MARSIPTPSSELLAAVERLARAAHFGEITRIIRTTARRLIGADGITLVLREENYCHYIEEDAISPLWKGQRFPLRQCISGWVIQTRQPAIISDIKKDARIPQELYARTFVRSLAMVPINTAEPLGALGAYWRSEYEPSGEELDTLETIARATAIALEHVHLIATLSKALNEAELARDELRHRVKNAFAATQALAGFSLPAEQARTLNARISALAKAHELLDRKLAHQSSIEIGELLRAELEAYESETPGRLDMEGPKVILDSAPAIALGLAINELAANAMKYGALSTAQGRLTVKWRREDSYLVLEWTEADGPEVRAAALESFGTRLLRRLIEGQLRGSVQRRLEPRGVVCILEFPIGQRMANSERTRT